MPNILIELLKQKAAKDEKKTAAFPSRRRWRPGRRRGGGNFIPYDLGRVKIGESTYNDLVFSTAGRKWTFTYNGSTSTRTPAFINLADQQELESQTFAVSSVETFAESFYRILRSDGLDEEYYRFGLTFDGVYYPMDSTNTKWTDTGFALTQQQLNASEISITSQVSFWFPVQLKIKGPDALKCTTEYDYNADAVTYRPAGEMKAFILPVIQNWALASLLRRVSSDEQWYGSLGFYINPRDDVFADAQLWDDLQLFPTWHQSETSEEYRQFHNVSSFFQSRFTNTPWANRYHPSAFLTFAEPTPLGTFDPSTEWLPVPPYTTPPTIPNPYDSFPLPPYTDAVFDGSALPITVNRDINGGLVLIIQQNGLNYYFWEET